MKLFIMIFSYAFNFSIFNKKNNYLPYKKIKIEKKLSNFKKAIIKLIKKLKKDESCDKIKKITKNKKFDIFFDKNKKYKILNVEEDGNCGYHCILNFLYKFIKRKDENIKKAFYDEKFLNHNFLKFYYDSMYGMVLRIIEENDSYDSLDHYEKTFLIIYLRILMVNHLLENKSLYIENIDIAKNKYNKVIVKSYLLKFSNWIDGLAFAALSNLFKLKIVIFESKIKGTYIYNAGIHQDYNYKIYLYYSKKHYDLIIEE